VVAKEAVLSRARAWTLAAATGLATVLVFLLVAWDSKVNNPSLQRALAGYFPVQACDFIRTTIPPGPLYNNLNWVDSSSGACQTIPWPSMAGLIYMATRL
jgi:hypothetical protein